MSEPTDETPPSQDAELKMKRLSRRSLVQAAVYVGALGFGITKLSKLADADGTPWLFRRGLETNEVIWRKALSTQRKAPTYTLAQVTESRENGSEGLSEDFDPADWNLSVEGVNGRTKPVIVTLAQLRRMPQTQMITEFFCIEGWSVIQRWKGVLMSDFVKVYPPKVTDGQAPDLLNGSNLVPYVGMQTPDEGYFVGLDMRSALHAQTMLCLEMNGEPLTMPHGAPLRLVIPVNVYC